MNNKDKRRSSLTLGERMMFLAGILFCLVLITTALMSGLFARYCSTAEGRDTARVAKFDVSSLLLPALAEGKERHQVDVVCAQAEKESGTFQLTVTSDSEVAVRYDLQITFDRPIPAGVSVTLDNTKVELEENSLAWRKEAAGTFPPGMGNTRTHNLTFTMDWAHSNLVGSAGEQDEQKTMTLDFTVDVTAVQVD